MNKPKIIQIIDVVSNAIAGNRIDEDFIKSCIYGKVLFGDGRSDKPGFIGEPGD